MFDGILGEKNNSKYKFMIKIISNIIIIIHRPYYMTQTQIAYTLKLSIDCKY